MSTTPEENGNDYPTRRMNNNQPADGNGNGDPNALRDEQNQTAARILGIDASVAAQRSSLLEGTNSIYVPGSEGAVIVAPDYTHLFARSDVAKNDHVAAFWDGQRGNYEVPEEKKTSGAFIAGVVALLVVIAAVIAFIFLTGDDVDEVDDVVVPDPSPTETVDPTPTETETPTPTETETAEPVPTETETETAEPEPSPQPTVTETQPTEGPATNGDDAEEEETFDPANVTINTGGVFVEDEANDVSGSGFLPDEELNFSIPEVDLGSVTTDSDGEFEAEITIQGPFADGTADLTIVGPASDNTEIVESIELEGSMDNEEG